MNDHLIIVMWKCCFFRKQGRNDEPTPTNANENELVTVTYAPDSLLLYGLSRQMARKDYVEFKKSHPEAVIEEEDPVYAAFRIAHDKQFSGVR